MIIYENKGISKPEDFGIKNYEFDKNGFLNVDGDVYIAGHNLTKLPFKFGKVDNFNCNNNKLTTLEGSPKKVNGTFYCEDNNLTSLKGAPEEVGGDFMCNNNKLTTLEGSPKTISRHFACDHNKLTTLKGGPKIVKGSYYCTENPLKSLEYAPTNKEVKIYSDID